MEYSRQQERFMEAYDRGMEGMFSESSGFNYLCELCRDNHDLCCEYKAKHMWESGGIQDDGSFYHNSCEICGSKLGGERYAAHALIKTVLSGQCQDDNYDPKEIVHLEVCQDCVLYMANGDVPESWGDNVQEDARFDRFDICEAWYLYASHYHDGQWSPLYRVFGRLERIKFKASPMMKYETLTDNGKVIYDNLVERQERGK